MHSLLLYTLLANWGKALIEIYVNFRQWKLVYEAEQEPNELKTSHNEAARVSLYQRLRLIHLRRSETKMFFTFCDIVGLSTALYLYHPAKKWAWIASNFHSSIWQPVMYVVYESVFQEIIRLPFNLLVFATIRNSFSHKPLIVFIMVFIAQACMKTLLLGISTYYSVYSLDVFGRDLFLWIWLIWLAFTTVVTPVYVDLVLPSLEEYTHLPRGSLKDKIENLATQIDFPTNSIYVSRGGQEDEDHVAYFAGLFSSKAIIISANLVLFLNEEEIVAVVAHELGHWKLGHSWYYLISRAATFLGTCYLMATLYDHPQIYEAFKIEPPNPGMSFIILSFYILPPLERVLKAYCRSITRRCEFQADEFAKQYGHTVYLRSALRKMYETKKIFPIVDPFYSIWYFSHPSILERIRALQ